MRNPKGLVFFLFVVVSAYTDVAEAQDETSSVIPVNVGVILDMDSWVGKLSNSCIYMAISDFYSMHPEYKTKLVLHTRDSKSDAVGAVFAAMDLLQNLEVQMIVGPQRSSQTEFIVDVGFKAQIPIISFSATIPSIYSRSPYFVQTTPDDHTQVKAIASIVEAFMWRKVILIHEDTDYGNRLVPHLIDAFQDINTIISYRSVISVFATDDQIIDELQKLVTMKTSVFILHMSSPFGSKFIQIVKQVGMMTEGYVWIITNGMMNVLESLEPSVIDSMQGVLGVTPYIPPSEKRDDFVGRWKTKFLEENRDVDQAEMVSFGLWAYDTIWALAMAAEKVGDMEPDLFKMDTDAKAVDLLDMKVSPAGSKLLEVILKSEFEGLSGKFCLVNRQLKSTVFQILNVVDKGGREIGFWTEKHGISPDLNVDSGSTYSTSAHHFRDIVWPGKPKGQPKGWVIPMDGKKLRIGVPMQDGFSELVNVSGYCIDVFESALERLPYPIPYEFIPFQRDDGKSAGDYNDLIEQVYHQKYDAVVGDITITANRSLYVDFAFPYTDGGIWMIVPLKKHEDNKHSWMFLHPLSKEFGLSMAAFIITIMFVWLFEQELSINEPSAASFYQQVKELPFYVLSTIPLAYRKKASNILSRVMVLIWLFLILGLALNYVVTLRSMLTLKRSEAAITDSNDLIKNGEFVGYRKGTFVVDLLKRNHFVESKLVPYSSPEECQDLLSKGSENGGVAAVFEEMPYADMFLTKFCSKYIKVGPSYKSDGFGFAFQKGSPLVSDISKAVLEVSEGHKLRDIERSWFSTNTTCNEDQWANFISKNRSSLFQISLCVLILSLLITSSMFASYLFKSPLPKPTADKKKQ
ncbi:hypothetical protein ACHQM5_003619 [Ranunculus cassubicifolius]